MKAQDLKSSVLQLAIQGKLVEQNLNDEPASVLLEKIKAEKEKLIKEKKIKKEKPLPEISEEEKPFDIPDSWEWIRLSDITTCITCGLASTPNYVENGKMFLSAKNIKPNKFIPYDYKMISQEDYDKLTRNFKPELNDILLTRVGAGIGEAAIIDKDLEFAIYVSLTLIKPIHKYIHAPYLLNWINSPNGRKNCLSNIYGKNASQGNLNVNLVRGFVIPLPPLEEQKRIVAKIEEVLEKIEEYDKTEKELTQLENLFPQDMKKAILQYAIQGKLVEQNPNDESASVLLEKIKAEKEQLIKEKKIKKEKPLPEISEEEKPFDIPYNWEWVRMGNISEKIHYGYTASAKFEDTGVKMLRITDIQNNRVDWSNVPYCEIEENKLEGLILSENNILIARTGGTIGKSFIVKNVEYNSVFASYLIRVMPCKYIYPEYLKLFLESPLYWGQLKEKSQGTGQPNVNAVSLSNLTIPLPPLEEQKRIVDKVEKILNYVDRLQNKIDNQNLINKIVKAKSIELSEKKEVINN